MQEAVDDVDPQVMDIAELTVIDALEACGANHNKYPIKGARVVPYVSYWCPFWEVQQISEKSLKMW